MTDLADHQEAVEPKSVSAREITAFIFRHIRLLSTLFLVPIFLGTAAILFLPKSYEAESRLLLLLGREYTLTPDATSRNTLSLESSEIVNSELAILEGASLKERVLKTFGVDKVYPPATTIDLMTAIGFLTHEPATPEKTLQLAVRRMTKDLRLQPVPDANIINLTFRHRDPAMAANVLNKLVDEYLEERRNIYARNESQFLISEREDVHRQLVEAEQRLQAFTTEHGVSNYDEQVTVLLREKSDLSNRLAQATSDFKNSEARLSSARETLKLTKREIVLYSDTSQLSAIDSAKTALLHLKVRREDLLSRFRDDSRAVGDVDREIKVVEDFLRKEGPEHQTINRTGVNPVYEILERVVTEINTDIEGLTAQRDSLARSLAFVTDEIDRLSGLNNSYRTLVRERDVLDLNYRTYATRIEESKIQEGILKALAANVRIVQRAVIPQQPRNLMLVIGSASVFGGILLALLGAFIKAATLDVFITPEGVERLLKLRVLSILPYAPETE